jgi:branched-chain amino acid transport system permease protein
MRPTLARYIPFVVLVALVVAAQAALSALKVEFYLTQLTMAAYYTLVALGLCLLMGYAGQVSLGHAGFFTIGGYTSAVLTTVNLAATGVAAGAGAAAGGAAGAAGAAGAGALIGLLSRLGILVPGTDAYGGQTLTVLPWAAFAAALLVTAVVAVLVGIPVLRLRGHYLAMATLAFGVIVARVVVGTRIFGEADGISDVPAFKLFAGLAISGKKALRVQNYYIAWAAVAAGFLLLINLIGSRAGRALRAIHGDETAASAMGVDVPRHKLAAFLLSALFAAVGGACLVHFNGGIGPGEASVMKSVRYVALVAAGGMGSAGGTLAVSTLLTFLSLRGAFGQLDDAVFGAILVAIMLFAPDGLFAPIRGWILRLLRVGRGARGAAR